VIALAFLWHQHQPYYPDDVTGENPMPWVRLHGVKSYYGMARHLLEFPEMACVINLVPSLLVQLRKYTEEGAADRPLAVSRVPADGLSEADCLYLLDNFFMANAEHMIRPLPRYFELYQRRGLGRNSAQDVLRRFTERDLRDLQVLFNLAWVHPLAVERDAGLRELVARSRGYSEQDKNWLLDKHIAMLREVVPLHKELADRGQVELTTTPFFHPILPLLLDKKLAREALPEGKLPRYTGGYPEDAEVQVRRAVELHARTFGRPPAGMWPAEGSVCQAMIPLLARHGVRWIATDEEILGHSTQGFVGRDPHGNVRNPGHLYRPYKVQEGDAGLHIVFRDHALSDMIGFHYQRSGPAEAVEDFLRHLGDIDRAVQGGRPALVSVILDGENCWEHYPGGGVTFLRTLYERCTKAKDVRPVSLGKYLEGHPPRDTLPRLFAGSWINHNFAIWIGHDEDNTAWDALHRTREHLQARAQQGHIAADRLRRAWEELYIAEGSDWFWWFGDDHHSAQDALFDALFRKHLQNAYLLLGDAPPDELSRAISRRGQRAIHTLPRSFLEVKIDGRQTFFEWAAAGHYACKSERGTMALATRGPLEHLYFGFDVDELFLRVDFDRPAREALAQYDALRVGFIEPAGWEVLLVRPGAVRDVLYDETPLVPGDATAPAAAPEPAAAGLMPLVVLLRYRGESGEPRQAAGVRAGVDQIVEVAVPFDALGLRVGQPIQFAVELLQGSQSRDRAPREGAVYLARPSPDFEQIMWDV
jgi:alpha-amylase/alpha-mannosidase (GH57 family)